MRQRKRYHETLGVPKDATPAEVKRAYRALVRELHPDRMRDPELARRAEERLKEINAAWSDFLAARRGPGEGGTRPTPRPGPRTHTADESDEGQPPAPPAPRRRDRESRDRHRSERARWLREREERERRAREQAEALRREREAENYERRLDQQERGIRILRFALVALAAAVLLGAALLVAMLVAPGR